MSHPTWVRGLKFRNSSLTLGYFGVAPHVGAWIEILYKSEYMDYLIRRTPRGCVD